MLAGMLGAGWCFSVQVEPAGKAHHALEMGVECACMPACRTWGAWPTRAKLHPTHNLGLRQETGSSMSGCAHLGHSPPGVQP